MVYVKQGRPLRCQWQRKNEIANRVCWMRSSHPQAALPFPMFHTAEACDPLNDNHAGFTLFCPVFTCLAGFHNNFRSSVIIIMIS
ncbi:hypothetical protein M378DRAFT_577739 [Amanita muscaria Koide BX008]|uniref:Uncharacterized protein n=1 Tax=Amanita muscaria (strain Koide BX008) TaxID=946122 RepID=A0A0C2X738_AMAMK|nr:hypothetical protein M378DRAFT_577739 [Amanita muscaria Koide BX008]